MQTGVSPRRCSNLNPSRARKGVAGFDGGIITSDAGEHEGRQRLVDHRLVVHRQQLLRDRVGERLEPGTGSPAIAQARAAPRPMRSPE